MAIVIQNEIIKGIWPYFKKRKFGLDYLTLPPLTPYLGPMLFCSGEVKKQHKKRSIEKRVLGELIAQLPKVHFSVTQAPVQLKNGQPLHWHGFEQTTRYTYRLDLSKPSQQLLKECAYSVRQQIKVRAEEIQILQKPDISDIYTLFTKSFHRQNLSIPVSLELIKKLDIVLTEKEQKIALLAKVDNRLVASVYVVFDHSVAYLLLTGRSEEAPNGTVSLLIWRAILIAQELGLEYFDFEGSMLEGVAQFFSSFGANQTPYHRFVKASNKGLFLVLKALNKI